MNVHTLDDAAAELAREAPVPARHGPLFAGTAGWTDRSLDGLFYPEGVRTPEGRLRYYASQFPMVEVDSAYYALPTEAMAQRWVERTPPGFVFHIKAHAGMTGHPVEVSRLPVDLRVQLTDAQLSAGRIPAWKLPDSLRQGIWEHFHRAMQPLVHAGRLGRVLLQFPPWFEATRGRVRMLEQARTYAGDLPLAVEFRHPSWFASERLPRVLDLLRDHGMVFVCVDSPQGTARSVPPIAAVADASMAIVRLHGRRRDTWGTKASVQEKYDYRYTPEELLPWAEKCRRLEAHAGTVHAVFNNCVRDHAIVGARDLVALRALQTGSARRSA